MADDIHRPDDDDLAALDFLAPDQASGRSALDVLADLEPGGREQAGPSDPVFVVTNPPGTVTVSTFIDGRVHHIDLSPEAATLTEGHLAEEIVVVARLAAQEARAAQYAFMLDGMREEGHDDSATRDFLSRDLELPSPEQATAARAQVFATRYGGEE